MRESGNLQAFWSDRYFTSLDGLRALCILLVLFDHSKIPHPSWITGWLGVDIFFVLSGFLITTLLLREGDQYGNVSLKGFYVRRIFRILPVYFVVLAAYFPIILILRDTIRWHQLMVALPYLLTFTQEFRPASSGTLFGQTWSLGFEEMFYLLWPLLLIALTKVRSRLKLPLLSLGCLLLLLPAESARSYGGLFLGSALAILLDKGTQTFISGRLARIPLAPVLLLVLCTYILVTLHPALVLTFSAATCLLVACLVLRRSWVRSALETPFVVLLGKRSYSMYLVHVVVLDATQRATLHTSFHRWYVVLPVAYFLSFGVATGLYYLVEKPSVHYGRSISKKLRAAKSQDGHISGVALIQRPEESDTGVSQ
jgi:peptidoglycan/LPS O-acetylase OafA/YrhL